MSTILEFPVLALHRNNGELAACLVESYPAKQRSFWRKIQQCKCAFGVRSLCVIAILQYCIAVRPEVTIDISSSGLAGINNAVDRRI